MTEPGDYKPPNLLRVKTYVFTCTQCKRWIARVPQWCGTGDKGDECQYCHCSSAFIREGRPIGPRSKHWSEMARWFNELYRWLGNDDILMETVKVEGGW